jgi:thioredoxin-dependent peroxiredoxin
MLLRSDIMTILTKLATGGGAVLALVAGLAGFGPPTQPELNAGDEAPPFQLPGSDGRSYRLADYRGKSAVVLAWFPKAFTSG